MGNQLLSGKQAEKINDPMAFIMKHQQNITFVKLLRDNKLFHTILGTLENEGPVVVKTYLLKLAKSEKGAGKLGEYKEILQRIQEKLYLLSHPNVMPSQGLLLESKAAFLIRQYFPFSLRQRMCALPALTHQDKLWFAFQLLCGLSQIHSEEHYHGDIKPQNVMVTSWNWLFITDFSPYKPLYLASDNLGEYTFFFSPDPKKYGCYLAPERFVQTVPQEAKEGKVPIETIMAMDIFSLACVIAEIFIGHPLFDLPKIQAYKRGDIDPKILLKEIEDRNIKDLIQHMIQADPTKRKKIHDYLDEWCTKVFPKSFTLFFYYFIGTHLHPSMSSPDRRVAHVYKYIDVIWNVCFNKSEPLILRTINNVLFEKLREDPLKDMVKTYIKPTTFHFCLDGDETNRIIKWNYINEFSSEEEREKNRQSIIVIIHLLGMALGYCKIPSTKICALAMLRQIGFELNSPHIIMQYILPYHISCIQDENTSVAVEAAEGGVELLDFLGDRFELHPTDFKVFSRYIFPEYQKLCKRKEPYAVATFVKIIGKLAVHGKRFIERGLIAHIKYLRDLAAKEFGKRERHIPEAAASLHSTVMSYEADMQELFNGLYTFCKRAVESFSPVVHSDIPNHLHEYTFKKYSKNVGWPYLEEAAIFR